jgi:hypothetical protein
VDTISRGVRLGRQQVGEPSFVTPGEIPPRPAQSLTGRRVRQRVDLPEIARLYFASYT